MAASYRQLFVCLTLSFMGISLVSCDKNEHLNQKTAGNPTRMSNDNSGKESSIQADNEELVPLFIPALSAILLAAEKQKGAPLTKEEVLDIRDNSTSIMSPKSMVKSMAEKRGYGDIDPENCWNEWQLLRKTLNTDNDEDTKRHEAVVIDNPSDDPAMLNAEKKARETLGQFRLQMKAHPEINPMIKIRIEDINTSSRMWLFVDKVEADGFEAHLFEVPSNFEKYQAGDSFSVKDKDILDWMLNNNGEVYGAYTIRVLRNEMSKKERKKMDEYMGVEKFL